MRGFDRAIVALILIGGTAGAEEIPVSAPVREVKLFKNNLAVVTRAFDVEPSGGAYLLEDCPKAVHGTFWIETEAEFRVRSVERTVERSLAGLDLPSLLPSLVGKEIDIVLGENDTVSGKIVSLTEKDTKEPEQSLDTHRGAYGPYGSQYLSVQPPVRRDQLLVLKTSSGMEFIDINRIWRFRTSGMQDALTERVPQHALLFDVSPGKAKRTISFSYVARGMVWAPSYKLDLRGEQAGSLAMKATLRNELSDLSQVQIHLISGFPSIRFERVTSPFSQNTSIERFFQELNFDPGTHRGGAHVLSQQAVLFNAPVQAGGDSSAWEVPANLSDGMDLHFQDVGKQTIALGEAAFLPLGEASVKPQRIVRWEIPDCRDEFGRFVSNYNNRGDAERFQDSLWDAVVFQNPFEFPMTTAPTTTYRDGKLFGQTITYWTAPGEPVTVNITKALNVRARHTERELEGNRERVYVMGNDYQRSLVQGTLTVRNLRNRKERLVISRKFSGDLLEAEGSPVKELLESGVYSVNERNALRWEMEIGPGEEIVLQYKYSVLVDV